ncbi:hypothetical protein AAVH_30578 [Aphelenchoides avenae]|nr:hypothetical protein AAVH_30578 [Aphelenchus avenae]
MAGCVDYCTLIPMRFSNSRLNSIVLRHSHELARQRQFRLKSGTRLELFEEDFAGGIPRRVFEIACKHNRHGACLACLSRANDFVGLHRIKQVSLSVFWQKQVPAGELARSLPPVCYAESVTIEKNFVHDDYTGAIVDYLNIFDSVKELTLRAPFTGLRYLKIQPPKRKRLCDKEAEAEIRRYCFGSCARENGCSRTVDLSGWRFSTSFESVVVHKLFPLCWLKTTVRLHSYDDFPIDQHTFVGEPLRHVQADGLLRCRSHWYDTVIVECSKDPFRSRTIWLVWPRKRSGAPRQ